MAALLGAKVDNCALGQGQAPTAVRLIEEGVKQGSWVFLANCHLMLSWMPTLEKMIEGIIEGNPHPKYRLWLSSSPNPDFPITILQRGIKMTTEPPKGLRSNMLTLFNTIGDEQFNRCEHQASYKKLLFSLVWFHAILLERRKFKSLGFNIPYDFNESDFAICHDLIIVFLDEYPDRIPFDAMKYLIAEVMCSSNQYNTSNTTYPIPSSHLFSHIATHPINTPNSTYPKLSHPLTHSSTLSSPPTTFPSLPSYPSFPRPITVDVLLTIGIVVWSMSTSVNCFVMIVSIPNDSCSVIYQIITSPMKEI